MGALTSLQQKCSSNGESAHLAPDASKIVMAPIGSIEWRF